MDRDGQVPINRAIDRDHAGQAVVAKRTSRMKSEHVGAGFLRQVKSATGEIALDNRAVRVLSFLPDGQSAIAHALISSWRSRLTH